MAPKFDVLSVCESDVRDSLDVLSTSASVSDFTRPKPVNFPKASPVSSGWTAATLLFQYRASNRPSTFTGAAMTDTSTEDLNFTTDPKKPVRKEETQTAGGFQNRIESAGPHQLVVVRFTKTDCNKCALTTSFLGEFVSKYDSVIFLDADMAENLPAIGELNIEEVPTFVAFKGNKEVGRYVGTDEHRVEALITNHT